MVDFVHIFHKALNSWQGIKHFQAVVPPSSSVTVALEGDVCWIRSKGEYTFYFRHPKYIFDRPNVDAVAGMIDAGQLVELNAALRTLGHQHYVLETKIGTGPYKPAICALLEQSLSHPGEFVFDSFSYRHLCEMKRYRPDVTTSLHTEAMFRTRVLSWAPQPLSIALPNVSDLACADAVSIRYHVGDRFVQTAAREVTASGKALFLSRLYGRKSLSFAEALNAQGAYVDEAALDRLLSTGSW